MESTIHVDDYYSRYKIIKECIKEHKDEMKKQGLCDIYIRENGDYPAVIFTLRTGIKPDYNYWYSLINLVTECASEYVSCYHEDDEVLKLDKKLIKFII